MAPFHPLRHSARALLARAGAALAVFTTIAVLLLAGGSEGPLTDAEAQKGEPAAASLVATAGSEVTPPTVPAPPAEGADPAEPAPSEEPAAEDPAVEGPAVQEPTGEGAAGNSGGDPAHTDHGTESPPPATPGADDGAGHAGDPGDSGESKGKGGSGEWDGDFKRDNWDRNKRDNWDGDGGPDDFEGDRDAGNFGAAGGPDDFGRRGPDLKGAGNGDPAGGTKGPNPTAAGGDPAEPAPAGRPQVVQPVAAGEPDTGDSDGASGDGGAPTQTGSGLGDVVDSGTPGSGGDTGNVLLAQAGPTSGSDGGSGGGGSTVTFPADTSSGAFAAATGDGSGAGGGAGEGAAGGSDKDKNGDQGTKDNGPIRNATKTVEKLVSYVPDGIKAALAALGALAVLLGIGYLLAAMRARRLSKQRRELLQEVGLLQSALLPPVPDKVGALLTSVAYRPADGPGAGGDFYDVLPLPGGRVGFILGDVSGHGRGALARTAFMRYTLRAYLEAGLEPRVALQVAGRVIDDNLGGDFATVLLAVHDPETGSLTYATAGHPAPIVVGPQPHDPVTAGSSPPIGVGVRTGLRQTTVPLVPGSVACLFTDGLMEARTTNGILGRERLAELLDELGKDASARRLIEGVAAESTKLSDDMAAVIVSPTSGVTAGLFRTEQLELSARELEGPIARRFLEACGLPPDEVEDAEHDARLLAERFGGVVLHVVFGNRLRVEVLPRNVESIEAASRRVSAGTAR